MDAVMGSSSSPFTCLKFVSCRDEIFSKSLRFYDFGKTNFKNKDGDLKLVISISSSRRGVCPVYLSSFNTQSEVDDHEFLIEESANGCTIEAESESEAETETDIKTATETETETAAETQTVRVKFLLARECTFGQNFLIAGEDPLLGSWDPNNAIPLTWSDGHLWSVNLDIPIRKCIKFKFIMQESDGRFIWQPDPDRVFECFETDKILTLTEDWETPDFRTITETDKILNHETQEQKDPPSLKEVLVSDAGLLVLVPGLSQFPAPSDEPETLNGAVMVSTEAAISELDSKGEANALNSDSGPEISFVHENHERCENERQEMKQVDRERDYQDSQPVKNWILNCIQWGNNVMQKVLNVFGFYKT